MVLKLFGIEVYLLLIEVHSKILGLSRNSTNFNINNINDYNHLSL